MANQQSNSYWENRSEEIMKRSVKSEDVIIKQLNQVYDRSARELEMQLSDFYQKYANEGGMTLSQARRKIDRVSTKTLFGKIDRLLKKETLTFHEEEQLKMLRAKFTTTRLQLLVNEIDLILIEGFTEQQITMDAYLKRVGKETTEAIAGDIASFAKLATDEINMLVRIPWSGMEFSDVLWKNKEQMLYNLQSIVTTGLIRGESTQSMAKKLRDRVGNGKLETERVIRTETAHVIGETSAQTWEKNGIEEYDFHAKLDSRTSDKCLAANGQRFKLKDRQTGVNYPPLHPLCRSFTSAVVDD